MDVIQLMDWLMDHGFRVEYNSRSHCLVIPLTYGEKQPPVTDASSPLPVVE